MAEAGPRSTVRGPQVSTLDEKLEQGATHSGRAQRKLSSLTGCAGFRVESGTAKRPTLCSICPADRRTYWRRVDGTTEADALYELEREERETP